MCCWAIVIAGIERVVLGARHVDAGKTTVGDYTVEHLISMTRRELALTTGIAVDEMSVGRRLRRMTVPLSDHLSPWE